MVRPKPNGSPKPSTASIGFEATVMRDSALLQREATLRSLSKARDNLWLTADKLRNNMDAAEPSGARQTARQGSPKGERGGANQYKAENVFWVPADARWSHLQANAKQPTIGKTVDDAMVAIERDNPRLKGVLPKDYARPGLDPAPRDSALSPRAATPQSLSAAKDNQRLGELIDLIATIELTAASEGEKTHRSVDLLGRVYDWSGATKTAAGSPQGERGGAHQYFLTRFASAEGKNGGVAKCEVRSASVEVKTSRPFVVRNSSFGISPARRLAVMNLALRGIEADFGPEHADTFRRDLHPDLRADYVLANPPFNDSDWFRKDDDVRWQVDVPPEGNANFAWVQHFIHHLAPGGAGTAGGMAGFVLANGSMSSNQSGEGDIRRALIEADLVDCMVALPGQLFYSTQIPETFQKAA